MEKHSSMNTPNSTEGDFDLMKAIQRYLKNWIWFGISCVITVVLAFFHLRYATPEYSAYGKIMLLNEESAATPAAAILKDLKSFSETESKKVEDEMEVLKSRSLMEKVVKKLKLNVQFYMEGRFHNTQLFPNSPIKISFIQPDSIINASKLGINIEVLSETKFNYRLNDEDLVSQATFGGNMKTPLGDAVILPETEDISKLVGKKFFIAILPTYKVAELYKDRIAIAQVDEYSKVIKLSLNDPVALKARMIIDTLVGEYNRTYIEDKNRKSKNAADFIDERISLISRDLSDADNKIEQFKTVNKLTDITSEAELFLNSSSQIEQDILAAKTQLSQLGYMKSYVEDEGDFDFLPSNVGMSDGSINNLTSRYNDLLRERNSRLNGSAGEKNPIIINLNEQLSSIKRSLKQSLNNSSKSLNLQLNDLMRQYEKVNLKIVSVPGQVRKSRDIEREQGTKESLFLYLLEKREEAAISLTSTSPNAKIIDAAYSPKNGPVSPNGKIVYLAAIIIGLGIPFSVIYIKDLLDTKVNNKEDLQGQIKNITVLGEIPNFGKKENGLIKKNDRSIMSESFRIIRTNFDYVRRGRKTKKYDNVLFVTSTINSEGKSFVSLNMALTLANTEKRVLLIGADIRNPQIYSAIKTKTNKGDNGVGLTEYLVDKSIILGEAINPYQINNIPVDIMLSGKVPPNPAELLMSERMDELFESASAQYDYVIVDTAPSMLVTDTLLISKYAGHTIYVTRAGYTEKRILNFAKELHAEKKLNGMMLVVNDVKQSNFGYGAKYGYYGAPKKKGWFRKSTA